MLIMATNDDKAHDDSLVEQFIDEDGNPTVTLIKSDGTKELKRVCDLVAETFLGPRPDGSVIKHRDGNRLNCAADNLCYAAA
jgi:hypothetical protein